MKIAVDFDNTIASTVYPVILAPRMKVIMSLKHLKAAGHTIILWTCRKGKALEDAVAFCREYGLEFDAVNETTKEDLEKWGGDTRKIWADIYIDDRSINPEDIGILVNNWYLTSTGGKENE